MSGSQDQHRPRIYLAGPEVFLPDPIAAANAKKALCDRYGFEGVFPLDAEIKADTGTAPSEIARQIALSNEGLMRSCDLLIANCTPFRGASMDAGTAYEVGFMRALARPVLGYSNVTGDYRARSEALRPHALANPHDSEREHIDIEDFGLTENLMIAVAMSETGLAIVQPATDTAADMTPLAGFQACLTYACEHLDLATR